MTLHRLFQPNALLLAVCGFALGMAALPGCVTPFNYTARSSGLTLQQERWWAANAPRARFVEGKGWEVPGTPGYFDDTGKPLTKENAAGRTASSGNAAGDRNSTSSIWQSLTGSQIENTPVNEQALAARATPPPITDPAADLTPEQQQWWITNRHLARWTPPHGYIVAGIDGCFDSSGHRRPLAQGTNVATVSYDQDSSTTGTPSTYGPSSDSGTTKDGERGTMTLWDRITGRTQHDDDDSGSLWGFGSVEKSESKAKTALAAGEQAFREKRYSEAEVYYSEASRLWPNSPLQEDALFQRAECLFFADTYPSAFEAYEKLLTKYKRSRHLEKAVAREFAIGLYWFQINNHSPQTVLQPNFIDKTRPRLDTLGYAIKAMEKVRLNDPTGPLADDALMATANSYFTRQRYPDADFHYTTLIREYPKSEHQYQAHLFGIQAKLAIYQGPGYDGTPLKGAQDLIDQTLAQFREVNLEERQRLMGLRENIITARAERDWHMAQYYEGRGYNEAARHYYAKMLKDYPNSEVAKMVSARLAKIENLPAQPAPRLTWISALIPEPYDPKRLTVNPPAPNDATIRR